MDFKEFKLAHREYCKIFNHFFSRINKKFKKDTFTADEKLKIQKWLDEYIQQLHYTTLVLSDIESQVFVNQTLHMTKEREDESQIVEKVKAVVNPVSILCFLHFYEELKKNESLQTL